MPDYLHLDTNALSELKEIMEDEFSTLIDTYLNDSLWRIDLLKKASVQVDFDDISKTAHSFKGSSINIGAIYLAELCRQLEDDAKLGNLSHINELLDKINKEFEQVKSDIAQFIAQ